MYNPQLETFIRVADAGSFSKAAEESYITPTAIIKQINSLEANLGLHLFVRTHRGLTLTESGKSLYDDAKYIISYCKDSVQRAKDAANQTDAVIRIGTSPMTPSEFLHDLKIHKLCPDIKFRLVQFDNTPETAREILKNLGRDIDVVAGLFDEIHRVDWGCAALKLRDEPIRLALSIHHRFAEKGKLTLDDLRGEKILLIRRNWNAYTDRLRDFVEEQKLTVEDFDFFKLDVFNRCENGESLLVAFDLWKNAHPLIKILPVEWDFTIPYGLLHSPDPSKTVGVFLNAVQHALQL
ncbi:MAG: LysR family transcriptional regulator [Clostridiales bacterium]|nr:LysR family transcriptional regulator [Clostridiales bacterium]